jgi:hypothetical protein
MEIGKKKVRKDGKVVDIWGEYGKRFTNGHKCFNASEVKAVNELQAHEELYRADFARLKNIMTKPKDCMAGDLTPRTKNGDLVMNPNSHGANVNGEILFPPGHELKYKELKPEKLPPGQIGVPEGKYDILGNSYADFKNATAQPEDLFKKTQEAWGRKAGMKNEAEELARCKVKVAAERQQKRLTADLARMKLTMDSKQREVEYLQTVGNLGMSGRSN